MDNGEDAFCVSEKTAESGLIRLEENVVRKTKWLKMEEVKK